MKNLTELLKLAENNQKKTLSVAAAQDKEVLKAVNEAVKLNIINAILVGDSEKIYEISKEENLDLKIYK